MSEVVRLPVITTQPIPPGQVLEGALDNHREDPFKRVIVIGVYGDDEEYYATSDPDSAAVLWDLERCRHKLMRIRDAK